MLALAKAMQATKRRSLWEIRGFDLTQADFGKILGIGQAQLSKYEKGRFVFEEMAKRLQRHVVHPLASLLGADQLSPGDVILIDCDRSQLALKIH